MELEKKQAAQAIRDKVAELESLVINAEKLNLTVYLGINLKQHPMVRPRRPRVEVQIFESKTTNY